MPNQRASDSPARTEGSKEHRDSFPSVRPWTYWKVLPERIRLGVRTSQRRAGNGRESYRIQVKPLARLRIQTYLRARYCAAAIARPSSTTRTYRPSKSNMTASRSRSAIPSYRPRHVANALSTTRTLSAGVNLGWRSSWTNPA